MSIFENPQYRKKGQKGLFWKMSKQNISTSKKKKKEEKKRPFSGQNMLAKLDWYLWVISSAHFLVNLLFVKKKKKKG